MGWRRHIPDQMLPAHWEIMVSVRPYHAGDELGLRFMREFDWKVGESEGHSELVGVDDRFVAHLTVPAHPDAGAVEVYRALMKKLERALRGYKFDELQFHVLRRLDDKMLAALLEEPEPLERPEPEEKPSEPAEETAPDPDSQGPDPAS